MICETCEQEFQDTAVKIYKGRKVCPSCFRTLMGTDVPDANRQVQVVQTQAVFTTVCPECNAEVHKDTRKCPHCGASVKRIDRMGDRVSNLYKSQIKINSAVAGCLSLFSLFLFMLLTLFGVYGMVTAEEWWARVGFLVLVTSCGSVIGIFIYLVLKEIKKLS